MPTLKPVVLVTGANGEIGHGLIDGLTAHGRFDVVAMDLRELDPSKKAMCRGAVIGNILDRALIDSVMVDYDVRVVCHLAAMLSTSAERDPLLAHKVNVEGTLGLLEAAMAASRRLGEKLKFMFPSSIAVYGLPDVKAKAAAGRVREDQFNAPVTMYGCNKLYGEHLGRYYARHYRQLSPEAPPGGIDFRSIRFPGLISAFTVPTGGTSDYAPEMIHAAARNEPYACFVREDVRMSFMAMPDAVDAIIALLNAGAGALTQSVYNIASFNPSAAEFAALTRSAFPEASIRFAPDLRRQAIVDSWPEDVDDAAARRDFGFQPAYDRDRTFHEYLLPNIKRRYGL